MSPALAGKFFTTEPATWEAQEGMRSVLIQAVITKYHRLGSFQTTEMYFSLLWSLEVQSQGASMVG